MVIKIKCGIIKLSIAYKEGVRLRLDVTLAKLNNLTQRLMYSAPPDLAYTYDMDRRSKDLVRVYLSYASSVAMLLRAPVLARPQHSGSDC